VDICIFEYGIYFAYLQQAYLHTYAVFAWQLHMNVMGLVRFIYEEQEYSQV
jgi:hypothetical protein